MLVLPYHSLTSVSNQFTVCNYCCSLCGVVSGSKVSCAATTIVPPRPCQVSPNVGPSTSSTLAIILGVTIGGGVLLVVVIAVTVAVVCHRMKESTFK
jgi:hypothetical protein